MSPTTTEPSTTTPVLRFLTPPPGLDPLETFELGAVTGELFTLRATDAPDVRLFLLDPAPFFPDYRPEVPEELLEELGTHEPAVLVVVRPGEDAHTANLLAPVLINPASGTAVQTVLEGTDWPLRAPLQAT